MCIALKSCIGIGHRLECPEFESRQVQELFLQNFQTCYGALTASYLKGTGVLFRGVKWPRREVDHKPPSNAEVKNEWSYNLYSPYMPSRHGKVQLFPTSTMFEGQNTYYEFNVRVQEL